jgi:hypothetical protein
VGTAFLTWRERGASGYIRGGVEGPDFVPGLSDVDLTIVLAQDPEGPGSAARRVRRRRDRMRRALPFTGLVLDWPSVYEETELRELVASSALTFGLGPPDRPAADQAGYLGDRASLDRIVMLERPGLYGAMADWHLLRGPGFQSGERPRDPQLRLGASWLELVFWWRQLFAACATPTGPRMADMCVKCIAEPVRILLWLAHGEHMRGRAEVIRRAIDLMPEERDVLRSTLELQAALPKSPEPPLVEVLPALIRISGRIAALIDAEADAAGSTEVRLTGGGPAELVLPEGGHEPSGRVLPLADWRGLASPSTPDDSFALLSADPREPAVLLAAASGRDGPYPTLRADGLMIRPGATYPRTRHRAIQCRTTDPVSFALGDGRSVAPFPNLRGWSAQDLARRAVAEHRAWLRSTEGNTENGPPPGGGRALGLLLTAARAALFLESVIADDPVLALTVAETGNALAAGSASALTTAEEAVGRYREFALHRVQPPSKSVSAMRELVLGLGPYSAA